MFDAPMPIQQSPWSDLIDLYPTVQKNGQGGFDYWTIPLKPANQLASLELGESLAKRSLQILRDHPESGCVLRRILRAVPNDCQVGEGFFCEIERHLSH